MAAWDRRVAWSESARVALDEIVAYVAQDSRDRAVEVLRRALDSAASLSTLAERGRVVPEVNDADVRELFIYRYRLLCRVQPDHVVILGFLPWSSGFCFLAARPTVAALVRRLTSD